MPDYMGKFLNISMLLLSFQLCLYNALSAPRHSLTDSNRQHIDFNKRWTFHFAYDIRRQPSSILVNLPHTWNAQDVLKGKINYDREMGIYEKQLFMPHNWANKRLFLYCEGANSVATLLVNHHFVSVHKGGYTAFCVEISSFMKEGEVNKIEMQVSNAYRTDVLPLAGDFNVYGGIHRPVSLLLTSKDCISPLDYASPGIYLSPQNISKSSASIHIRTKLSLTTRAAFSIHSEIFDATHRLVAEATDSPTNSEQANQMLHIHRPHLWNGKKDPYLYSVRVRLLKEGQVIDEVVQPLGLRTIGVSADKGFTLNGKALDLHGVSLHEDVEGRGSALDSTDYEKDMQLITELGATALRLSHYPHGKYFYELCDRHGLVLWSEIPFVGPGGYTGSGYLKNGALEEQVKQVLTEMIRQNYNHPSVCFWGLFNELKLDSDDPTPFLKELNALAKTEDSSRFTTCASFLDGGAFNDISDLIAWNKYYGWYGGSFSDLGTWADKRHQAFPNKPFALSECGAGASPFKHAENLEKPQADGKFHPEEWQTLFHEKSWQELSKKSFVWGKFIWVLADFGSSVRDEGDRPGINDKGLVTYDRSLKKDAFYFYKANWNPEPMVYLTERRNSIRHQATVTIKAYSTAAKAILSINGAVLAQKTADEYHRIVWKNVSLRRGDNTIGIRANIKGKILSDSCKWVVE